MADIFRAFVLSTLCLLGACGAHAPEQATVAQPADASGRAVEAAEILRLHAAYIEASYRFEAGSLLSSWHLGPTVSADEFEQGFADIDLKVLAGFDYLIEVVGKRGWVSGPAWPSRVEAAALDLVASRLMDRRQEGRSGAVAFAKSVLPELLAAVKERGGSPSAYASIVDQVALFEGGQQVYGSQFDCVDGSFAPVDVLEPEKLDLRRADVGLEPIALHRYSLNLAMQDYCASVAGAQ